MLSRRERARAARHAARRVAAAAAKGGKGIPSRGSKGVDEAAKCRDDAYVVELPHPRPRVGTGGDSAGLQAGHSRVRLP